MLAYSAILEPGLEYLLVFNQPSSYYYGGKPVLFKHTVDVGAFSGNVLNNVQMFGMPAIGGTHSILIVREHNFGYMRLISESSGTFTDSELKSGVRTLHSDFNSNQNAVYFLV